MRIRLYKFKSVYIHKYFFHNISSFKFKPRPPEKRVNEMGPNQSKVGGSRGMDECMKECI